MPFQSRAQRLPLVLLATAALAVGPTGTRLAAQTQTQTRQVSVESLIYDLKNPDAPRRQAAAHELGDPDALPRLQELTHDSDEDVARAAERATRRIAVVMSGQER